MSREKIIKRVRALLEKNQENGATEAEAMAALQKANQLMLEYYISENDISDPYIGEKCIMKEVPLIKSGYDLGIFYNDLTRLFDCEYFYNSKRIAFFGFEEDTELCAYFYNLIVKTCLKEKDLYLKSSEGKEALFFYHGRTVSSSFIKGFLIKVSYKMEEMYKNKVSNLPEQTGLMVIRKEAKVKEQFDSMNLKIKATKTDFTYTQMGLNAGLQKGEEFHLTQGIKQHQQDNTLRID
ncbi:DUF2786 domain-containing protein [Chryseobacterium lathyri]|uniref:Uncharacterized protein n=1 Tax=Chryseobacterium lathyri TaxID=395933 RepID=A0A511YFY0_9FLAO|nr:DUF2786 domain-containing protein [Chryseobacterium lathyri]GEN74104.1 hypothetical protein CLA01_41760 [Chryseobacterium lathyri]